MSDMWGRQKDVSTAWTTGCVKVGIPPDSRQAVAFTGVVRSCAKLWARLVSSSWPIATGCMGRADILFD